MSLKENFIKVISETSEEDLKVFLNKGACPGEIGLEEDRLICTHKEIGDCTNCWEKALEPKEENE